MDDLKALSTLARVVEAGSFRRAALDLGVAPQATSKTVRQLEAQLGVRLLHRTTRKLSLTDEGAAFLAQVRPALSAIRSAIDGLQAARGEVGGTLRITAPRSVGQHLVLPLLPPFMHEHPDVTVELDGHRGIGFHLQMLAADAGDVWRSVELAGEEPQTGLRDFG